MVTSNKTLNIVKKMWSHEKKHQISMRFAVSKKCESVNIFSKAEIFAHQVYKQKNLCIITNDIAMKMLMEHKIKFDKFARKRTKEPTRRTWTIAQTKRLITI